MPSHHFSISPDIRLRTDRLRVQFYMRRKTISGRVRLLRIIQLCRFSAGREIENTQLPQSVDGHGYQRY